jgi:hypothetical protein
MYKIYVVNNFNSNVNCIPPYIKLRKKPFQMRHRPFFDER